MEHNKKLTLSLFLLRATIFIVMFVWTLDKFFRPEHTSQVFENFYALPGFGATGAYVLGGLEMVVILAFVAGYKKMISYSLVLFFHSVSTLSSYRQYMAPYEDFNLLFFAAIPMLAACVTLVLLQKSDTLLSIE